MILAGRMPVVLLLVSAAAAAGQEEVELDGIVIHEQVELQLQQIYVTVTDRSGERVRDLPRSAFELEDEGRPQTLVTFESGDLPLTTALLLDASQSTSEGELSVAVAGLRSFVDSMGELDEARALIFSDRLLRASGWFGGKQAAGDRLLASLEIDPADRRTGGSSIFDHVHLGLSVLEGRQGRRVLILLSDGWDLHSVLDGEHLRRAGGRSRAMVYWVRLDPDPPTNLSRRQRLDEASTMELFDVGASRVPIGSWYDRDTTVERYFDLERLVAETGGRVVDAPTVEAIGPALEEILRELRDQYALGYYPDPEMAPGIRRGVKLRLAGSGLTVRARSFYVVRP